MVYTHWLWLESQSSFGLFRSSSWKASVTLDDQLTEWTTEAQCYWNNSKAQFPPQASAPRNGNHAIFQTMRRVAEAPLRAAALQICPGSIFLIIITPSSRQSSWYDCQEIKRTQHPVNLKIKQNPLSIVKKKKEFWTMSLTTPTYSDLLYYFLICLR